MAGLRPRPPARRQADDEPPPELIESYVARRVGVGIPAEDARRRFLRQWNASLPHWRATQYEIVRRQRLAALPDLSKPQSQTRRKTR